MTQIKEKPNISTVKKGSERLLYPELLRILAALAVVVIHAGSDAWTGSVPGSMSWYLLSFSSTISRFCIPVFVMVSGMFFLDPERNVTPKKIYTHSIPRLITAYVFWSVVYAVLDNVLAYGFKGLKPENILLDSLKSHFTLWFLIMLTGLYIIAPILRIITKHATKRQLEYFMLLSFIFAGVLPVVLRAFDEDSLVRTLGYYYYGNLNFNFVLGYTGCYIAGYYFKKYSLSKRARTVLYISAALGIVVSMVLTTALTIQKGYPVQLLWENLSPTSVLLGAALFVFFKEHDSRFVKYPHMIVRAIRFISSCTFGSYLLHDLINIILRHFGISVLSAPLLISIPVYSLAVFAVGITLTAVIKKIPVVNKYLI